TCAMRTSFCFGCISRLPCQRDIQVRPVLYFPTQPRIIAFAVFSRRRLGDLAVGRLHAERHPRLMVNEEDLAVSWRRNLEPGVGHCGVLLGRIVGTGGVLSPTMSAE